MKIYHSIPAALTVCLVASPTLADLTVDDAWNTWKSQLKAMGMTVSADESRDGDVLQIGPVTLSAEFPFQIGSINVGFAGPRFEDQGDGSVRMSLPETSQLTLGADIEGEGSINVVLDATMQDNTAIMSGTPDRVVSDGTVGGVVASLVSLSLDGEAVENATGSFTMGPYSYQNITSFGDVITIDAAGDYSGYEVAYVVDMGDGDTPSIIEAKDAVKDAKMVQRLVLPAEGISVMTLHDHLRGGLHLSARGTASTYTSFQEVRIDDEVLSSQVVTVSDYDQSIELNQSGVAFGGTTGVFEGNMQVVNMPFPFELDGESVAAAVSMPLLATGAPQDVGLLVDMQGLTVNPEVWGMVDPEGQLPRDPMALTLDLSGQVDVTSDLVDIPTLMGIDDPSGLVLPVSLNLNKLLLSAVGGELTGSGAFTFDASDMETFPGMPRPEGTLDLMLVGGNALLDTLVAMGLIPEDQAMGTRMMMGMFAVPGEGEDTITSQIVINAEGHVLANGQRLK